MINVADLITLNFVEVMRFGQCSLQHRRVSLLSRVLNNITRTGRVNVSITSGVGLRSGQLVRKERRQFENEQGQVALVNNRVPSRVGAPYYNRGCNRRSRRRHGHPCCGAIFLRYSNLFKFVRD